MATYIDLFSWKISWWMCIIKSPPHAYSITKHTKNLFERRSSFGTFGIRYFRTLIMLQLTCSGVWKQANNLIRKGCFPRFAHSNILRSHNSESTLNLIYFSYTCIKKTNLISSDYISFFESFYCIHLLWVFVSSQEYLIITFLIATGCEWNYLSEMSTAKYSLALEIHHWNIF